MTLRGAPHTFKVRLDHPRNARAPSFHTPGAPHLVSATSQAMESTLSVDQHAFAGSIRVAFEADAKFPAFVLDRPAVVATEVVWIAGAGRSSSGRNAA